MEKDQSFQLVFEGAQDGSPDTLRRLKSALIADLNFSVAEVQEFLNNVPLTIKRAQSEPELSVAYNTLQSAGAKVLILHPVGQGPQGSATDKTAQDSHENTLKPTGSVQPVPVTFEFDSGDPVTTIKAPAQIPSPELSKSNDAPLFEFSPEQTPKVGPSLFDEFKQQANTSIAPPNNSQTSIPSFGDLTLADEPETKPLVEKPAVQHAHQEQDNDLTLGADDPVSTQEAPQQRTQDVFSKDLSLSLDDPTSVAPSPERSSQGTKQADTAQGSNEESKATAPEQDPVPELSLAELQARAREKKAGAKTDESNNPAHGEQEANPELDDSQDDQTRIVHLKKAKVPWDLAMPIGIGLTILVSYNVYNYFNQEEAPPLANINIAGAAVVPKPGSAPKKLKAAPVEAKKEVKPLEVIKLYGENQYADMKVTWQLDSDGVTVKTAVISITTPRPPERSPDDIVHNVPPRPWLYKVEVDELAFDLKPDGAFSATGPARTYVENEAQRNRVVAEAKFVGKMDLVKHQLTGELTVKRGLEAAPDGKTFDVGVTGSETTLFLTAVVATDQDPESSMP